MLDNLVVLLGGRVAEKLVLEDISTGASNDIERATAIARSMVVKYGMSDKLGSMTFGSDNGEVFIGRDYGRTRDYSENVAAEIDAEIKSIIDEAYSRCTKLLTDNMDALERVAQTLLDKETIDAKEFEAVFLNEQPETPEIEEEITEE